MSDKSVDVALPSFCLDKPPWRLNLSRVNVFSGVDHSLLVKLARQAARIADHVLHIPDWRNCAERVLVCPECKLHGSRVNAKVRDLCRDARADNPVIVVTHSAIVLDAVRLAVLQRDLEHEHVRLYHFVGADGGVDQIIRPLIDSHGRIDVWPDGFFDQSDKDMDALLEWDRGDTTAA
jgi:hypothetical protein